ncbi:MAG TPA: hypothetical protein VG710_03935 [Opitutus sp.]|nr:hypothetical protein [Opitutus sp.]
MNHPIHFDVAQHPRRMRWFMGMAWIVVLAKCAWVWWAVEHWNMRFHPLWVIGPTLVFALLITALWFTHHED